MSEMENHAPGRPGNEPAWTSAAKSGIGKAINAGSDVAFTISRGIVTEVYYPREDIACIKDIGLIVTDGKNFFSDERLHTHNDIKMMRDGVPAYSIVNTCLQKKYVIKKEIITDPFRNTLLQRIIFKPTGNKTPLNLYVLVSPHINNQGYNNNGCIGDYKGIKMLFASKDGLTIAVACSEQWLKRSVGLVTEHGRVYWMGSKWLKNGISVNGKNGSKNSIM